MQGTDIAAFSTLLVSILDVGVCEQTTALPGMSLLFVQ